MHTKREHRILTILLGIMAILILGLVASLPINVPCQHCERRAETWPLAAAVALPTRTCVCFGCFEEWVEDGRQTPHRYTLTLSHKWSEMDVLDCRHGETGDCDQCDLEAAWRIKMGIDEAP